MLAPSQPDDMTTCVRCWPRFNVEYVLTTTMIDHGLETRVDATDAGGDSKAYVNTTDASAMFAGAHARGGSKTASCGAPTTKQGPRGEPHTSLTGGLDGSHGELGPLPMWPWKCSRRGRPHVWKPSFGWRTVEHSCA